LQKLLRRDKATDTLTAGLINVLAFKRGAVKIGKAMKVMILQ